MAFFAAAADRFAQYLTRKHDAKIDKQAKKQYFQEDADGKIKLSDTEKIPSVMLAFDIIERKSNEDHISNILDKIFEKNPKIQTQYSSAGETLLFAASRKGYCKVVKFLIDRDLNCRQVTPLGTVLHSLLAAFHSRLMSYEDFEVLVRLVLDKGCDINDSNHEKYTPFLAAVNLGEFKALQLFYDLGCDVNKTVNSGYHAIHLACIAYRPDILQILLSLKGINLHPVAKNGFTSLLITVRDWCNQVCFLQETSYCGSKHYSLRVKRELQVLAMVEQLLLIGENPNNLSTTMKDRILPKILWNLKQEQDLVMGRCYCSTCNNRKVISAASTSNLYSLEHDHICNNHYVECPCKNLFLQAEHDCEEFANSSEKDSQIGVDRPLTIINQIIASSFLYGSYYQCYCDNCLHWKIDLSTTFKTDTYFSNFILSYFTKHKTVQLMNPFTLKMICRSTIRMHMAIQETFLCIDRLPLPKPLLDYVAMKVLE